MFAACSSANIEDVKKQLASGESANKVDSTQFWEHGWTPIRYAALAGNKTATEETHSLVIQSAMEIIQLLISNGGDVNHQDDLGVTTLMAVARFKRRVHMVRFLIEMGADITIKDNENKTALDYANTEEMKILLN
jgi:ankyrin repeat protein